MTRFCNRAPVPNQLCDRNIHRNLNVCETCNRAAQETKPNYNLGLRLGKTPQINEDDFVGREDELKQLQTLLAPRPRCQNVVAVCGLGGIGKTQLTMQFAKKFGDTYSAVFWFDATDESTLKAGMAALAMETKENQTGGNVGGPSEEEWNVEQAREWLSRPDNDKWLVVYDNHDDPLPAANSTGYDIRNFFPTRAQGSILITTRSPRLGFAKQLRLRKLEDVNQGLKILETRSGREFDEGKSNGQG